MPGPRYREALVLAENLLVPGGLRCRQSLLPGGPRWASTCGGYPRFRNFGSISWETMTRIGVFLWSLKFLNFSLLSKLQDLLSKAGRPSLPGSPRCREVLVAGRTSLPGDPRCQEALVAGRPSLPGPRKPHSKMWPPLKTTWQDVAPHKTLRAV